MSSINTMIEDEQGYTLLLQLFHQPSEDVRLAKTIVKPNDVFLVKEPFFVTTLNEDYAIRVDHITDIIHISLTHELMPAIWIPQITLIKTAEEWIDLGHEAMRLNHTWDAIERYEELSNPVARF